MKKLCLSCLLFLAVVYSAWAMPEGPLHMYFSEADTILDVRVASVEKDKITLSVVEVLRGKKMATLVLRGEDYDFKKDDEWMLLSCESWRKKERGDVVGSFIDGPLGWICRPVFREDGKAYVCDALFDLEKKTPVFDRKIKDYPCITLDHFKQLMAGKPFVSWYIGAQVDAKKAVDGGSEVVVATFAAADTWRPVAGESDSRDVDMKVIDTLKGKLSGEVPVIYQLRAEQTNPEPEKQYIAFLGRDYRLLKLLPATKENVDAVKAVIGAK